MNGKGSKPRPMSDRSTFENNFDNIFRKPKPEDASSPAARQEKGDKNGKSKDIKM
jgi:hypothetical protein